MRGLVAKAEKGVGHEGASEHSITIRKRQAIETHRDRKATRASPLGEQRGIIANVRWVWFANWQPPFSREPYPGSRVRPDVVKEA
jgi:hypothetical protein